MVLRIVLALAAWRALIIAPEQSPLWPLRLVPASGHPYSSLPSIVGRFFDLLDHIYLHRTLSGLQPEPHLLRQSGEYGLGVG